MFSKKCTLRDLDFCLPKLDQKAFLSKQWEGSRHKRIIQISSLGQKKKKMVLNKYCINQDSFCWQRQEPKSSWAKEGSLLAQTSMLQREAHRSSLTISTSLFPPCLPSSFPPSFPPHSSLSFCPLSSFPSASQLYSKCRQTAPHRNTGFRQPKGSNSRKKRCLPSQLHFNLRGHWEACLGSTLISVTGQRTMTRMAWITCPCHHVGLGGTEEPEGKGNSFKERVVK